jgi:hypothetical protein
MIWVSTKKKKRRAEANSIGENLAKDGQQNVEKKEEQKPTQLASRMSASKATSSNFSTGSDDPLGIGGQSGVTARPDP